MDPSSPANYLFAIFIFILLSLFLMVYKYIMKPNIDPKTQESPKENDESLFKLYQHLEDLMDGFESYMEEVKDEIKAEREELSGLSGKIEELCSKFTIPIIQLQEVEEPVKRLEVLVESDQVQVIEMLNEVKNNIPQKDMANMDLEEKTKKVIELYKKGRKPDTIAKQLNMQKGEINLIIGLFNKKSKD